MKPMDRLELCDKQVKLAQLDEHDTMFDPATHPKPPDGTADSVLVDGQPVDLVPGVDEIGPV